MERHSHGNAGAVRGPCGLRAVVDGHGKVPVYSKTQHHLMNSGVIGFSITRFLAR